MIHGIRSQRPEWWAAGAIVELADDVHDSALMLLQKWPFGGSGGVDVKLTTIGLIHHSAGILVVVPTLLNGLHTHPRAQKLGAALLGAGAVSLGLLSVSRTRNRKVAAQVRQDAVLWVGSFSFFTYCRFYVFPTEIMAIFREDYNNFTPTMQKAMVGFTVMMSVFNLALWLDGGVQMVGRVKAAWTMSTDQYE